ncbi:MAG: DUF4199 domain-containing protein [Cyclobacteriaceae bacterium]|jgi:hypothetical protein|nr:DUF4199 domain-containing protein [Cytophagales bacterium]HNP77032.1 DUF4199 domain-containing protein [Cyclobacteriaceae bacterium]HQQ82962.1 DUF4199 domain-containing protein [Cyclobacteriaceae bacterium]
MKKTILVFGLISGAITSALMLLTMPLYSSGTLNMDNGVWVGFTGMVIALSLIFFAIKSYRDHRSRGVITFWQGLQIGLAISLISAIMYAFTWEICLTQLAPDFNQKMMAHYFEKKKAAGASESELQELTKMAEDYKNPTYRFMVSMSEIFPVGIVVTLISAALLRKKEFLPDQA